MAYTNEAELTDKEIIELLYAEDNAQGSEGWHVERLGMVTASNVRKVVARNRYGKPYKDYENYLNEKVAERITGQAKRFTSKPMEWGKFYEDDAAELYADITGNNIHSTGFVKLDDMDAGASSDKLVDDDGNAEIKCPNSDTFAKYVLENKVPDIYYDQCMWQMYVNKRDWTDFVAHDPDVKEPYPNIFIKRLYRDDEYIADMARKVKEFLDEVDRRVKIIENYKIYS